MWNPASALYEDVFTQEWQIKFGKAPFVRKEALALSPMVFVMWAERYEAFVAKYREVTFVTFGEALREPAGWDAIAKKPEWGIFKFGHTHPNQSNSGLMILVLMAYDFHRNNRALTLKDILDPEFQKWMNGIESATTGMSNSTGNMMRDMVLRGPSSFDALCVYENVVIDYLKSAEGRWGELHVACPARNAWNDNPYCILDAPWSSPEQRKLAGEFLDFLLTEPIQRESLKHGFRPGNANVPIKFPESPFVAYERFGFRSALRFPPTITSSDCASCSSCRTRWHCAASFSRRARASGASFAINASRSRSTLTSSSCCDRDSRSARTSPCSAPILPPQIRFATAECAEILLRDEHFQEKPLQLGLGRAGDSGAWPAAGERARAFGLWPALRESKTATLRILEQRFANLERREETMAEIDSDLTRIEAQVDLALDNAGMRGKSGTISANIDLVSQLLDESIYGEAGDSIAALDRSFGREAP